MEKTVTLVICDLCTRTERPATRQVTLDICHRHTLRDGQEVDHSSNGLERDNETLLELIATNEHNIGRSSAAAQLHWTNHRAGSAYNRLKNQGLVATEGKAQRSKWYLTKKGTEAVDGGS